MTSAKDNDTTITTSDTPEQPPVEVTAKAEKPAAKKPASKAKKATKPEGDVADSDARTPKRRKRYASVKAPVVEASIGGMFRFSDKVQAIKQLDALKERFIISKDQEENAAHPSLRMWIKDYQVTTAEKSKGYTGNYAIIRCKELEGKKYTLYAEKEEVDYKYHPQKKRRKQKHPDWGHPMLRQVKKGLVYTDVEEARAVLMKLHEDFPEVTIPLTNKLYVIIYSKQYKPPIRKFVLEIKIPEDGVGFYIDHYENTYQREDLPGDIQQKKAKNAETEEKATEVQGKFTSMVALRRKPKR
ncbi:MAG: hypothetical protein KDD76_05605 [Rickettsiales bacterium]|nr:hypothetical protein [Rickettsiales bacterium]